MTRNGLAGALIACCLALAPAAHAQLVNENLLVAVPKGYKVDFRDRKANMMITEMVPQAETVNGWTEMLTVQIFLNMKSTPAAFRARLEKLWADSCPKSLSNDVAEVVENGYPAMVWIQTCPLNQQTGKPEVTWFKAIAGNDSFYVVQKAFKFDPSREQIVEWTRYLKGISVCDSRVAASACPAAK